MSDYVSSEMKRYNYLISEINASYHEAALSLGLSDSSMSILYAICNNGEECLLNDIIRLSGLCKQTINSAIRKLEGEEIVYLEIFSGRKKKVCLTAKGKTFIKNTVLKVIEIENDIFESWSENEREAYIALTQKYLSSFKEKIKELNV